MDPACASPGRAVRRGCEIGLIGVHFNLMLIGKSGRGSGGVAVWFIGLFLVSVVLGAIGGLLGLWIPVGERQRCWHGTFTAVCRYGHF